MKTIEKIRLFPVNLTWSPTLEDSKPKILISGIHDRENLPIPQWLSIFGTFLSSNPTDATFRIIMNKDNPAGLWINRPKELTQLDGIMQEWPHRETVGNHIHTVVQNLDTESSINGFNYLALPKRSGMKKALRAAAFFHDIGKIKDITDPKHPQHSADMAESYFKIMNFTPEEVWLCHFLIRHHDLIGKIVNRNDPMEVNRLIDICHGFPTILQCLHAITIADISSIPELLNGVSYNIITDVNLAVKLAYEEIKRRSSKKTKRTILIPDNIRLFP